MVFTDYQFYKEEFRGTMPEESFERNIVQASALINYFTFDRAEKQITEKVKLATCAVCDVIQNNQLQTEHNNGHGEVKSENNDGYSVSFVTTQKEGETPEEALQRKAYQAAYLYLSGTGLLYRGYC